MVGIASNYETMALMTPDSLILASRVVRKYISAVLSHLVCESYFVAALRKFYRLVESLGK